jgi:hypothetical protein
MFWNRTASELNFKADSLNAKADRALSRGDLVKAAELRNKSIRAENEADEQ